MNPETTPPTEPSIEQPLVPQHYVPREGSTFVGYLGLTDGEFAVQRGNGQVETGWQIVGQVLSHDKEGNVQESAMITKDQGDGTLLEKTVSLSDLYSWQRPKAEASEKENAWEKHYAHIFSPILRPDMDMEHPGYDHLFNDDEVGKEKASTYDKLRKEVTEAQAEYDKFVTPEARKLAVDTLIDVATRDKELANIISSFGGKIDISDAQNVVDSIRSNPELRVAVGKHFVKRVNKIAKERWQEMPDRILRNTQKSISGLARKHTDKLSSKEYVALLCLSRVDGSFNPAREDNGTEYDSKGVAIVGQHRAVAEMVLAEAA